MCYNLYEELRNNVGKVLPYAEVVMKDCIDCAHWDQECNLQSVNCICSKSHSNFMLKDEVKPISMIRLNQDSKHKIKGRAIFFSDEEIEKAIHSRNRNRPSYPDMRELTDGSKKLLRRRK